MVKVLHLDKYTADELRDMYEAALKLWDVCYRKDKTSQDLHFQVLEAVTIRFAAYSLWREAEDELERRGVPVNS